jgi:hypothetical protein
LYSCSALFSKSKFRVSFKEIPIGKIRRRRSLIKEQAQKFFEACETENGWEGCKDYCQPQATFSAQADELGGVDTLEGYTDWMKGLFTPIQDGSFSIQSYAELYRTKL